MLPKAHRLNRVNFLKVLSASNYLVRSSDLVIRYLKNDLGFNRYSVVIPKKIVKLAVDRNRLKRIIFHKVSKFPGSFDIIIYPKNEKCGSDLNTLLPTLP